MKVLYWDPLPGLTVKSLVANNEIIIIVIMMTIMMTTFLSSFLVAGSTVYVPGILDWRLLLSFRTDFIGVKHTT